MKAAEEEAAEMKATMLAVLVKGMAMWEAQEKAAPLEAAHSELMKAQLKTLHSDEIRNVVIEAIKDGTPKSWILTRHWHDFCIEKVTERDTRPHAQRARVHRSTGQTECRGAAWCAAVYRNGSKA